MIYIMVVVLVAGILLFTVVSSGKGASGQVGRGGGGKVDKAEISRRWKTIQMVSKSGASGLRSSVLEADKLLDYVMKKQGYNGETMAERLKSAQREFTNRDSVWRAHKLRNTMAHEVDFDLVPSQANEAIRDFERAIKDLKAM
jgi:hypothetical protein